MRSRACSRTRASTSVGDEGGFAPEPVVQRGGARVSSRAIETAGFRPGEDIALGLDAASSEFYNDGNYELDVRRQDARLARSSSTTSRSWVEEYPIVVDRGRHGRRATGTAGSC